MATIHTEVMYEPPQVVATYNHLDYVRVTVAYDHALSVNENHVRAAQRLLADYGLDGDGGGYDWSMANGREYHARVFIRGPLTHAFTQKPRRGRRKADRTASDAPAGAV